MSDTSSFHVILCTIHIGTGLIKTLKSSVFEEVFALTKWFPKSLSYVIDVSGSMSDDIASVKEASKRIILNSLNGPADYVLATFNDPGNVKFFYFFKFCFIFSL